LQEQDEAKAGNTGIEARNYSYCMRQFDDTQHCSMVGGAPASAARKATGRSAVGSDNRKSV